MDRIIGIDLGTTNSVVAYYEQGLPVVIQNSEGAKTTPSVVLFKGADDILVGEMAKRQALTNPGLTIRSVKRFMGARFSELGQKTQGIGFKLVEGPDDSVLIDLGWQQVTPEQVSAEILKKMKATAEEFFGEEVTRAVVTVPAYFNDPQRAATKRAAEMAGLEVARIINEPTAAALAYGVDRKAVQKIAVFDFGGGTFDISILEMNQDVFEVRSTRGDTFLGGDNIDSILVEELADQFKLDTGIDLRGNAEAMQRMQEAAERVKCELSTATESFVNLPFIAATETRPLHLNMPFTRAKLNDLVAPMIPRMIDCCKAAMVDARLLPREIDQVLLVGGSTRIPAVQQAVRAYFGRDCNRSLNPDEAVAVGACIQASILSGGLREVILLDVTPLSLGVETAENVFSVLIQRNSSIPCSAKRAYTTTRDNQDTVKVHVLQGERRMCSENQSLGFFRLTGITPAPREIPQINVVFQIDANGILHVDATEATSGVTKSVKIESHAQVSKEEASSVAQDAEEHAEEDRRVMRKVYIRNQADELLTDLPAILEDAEDPVQPALAKRIKEIIFRYDMAASTNELAELESAFSNLKQASKELDARLYLQKAKRRPKPDGDGPGPSEG